MVKYSFCDSEPVSYKASDKESESSVQPEGILQMENQEHSLLLLKCLWSEI